MNSNEIISRHTDRKKRLIRTAIGMTAVVILAALMIGPTSALAQQMGMGTTCLGMMSGPWGIFSGILGAAFALSAIAAMIALATFLIRRSRVG